MLLKLIYPQVGPPAPSGPAPLSSINQCSVAAESYMFYILINSQSDHNTEQSKALLIEPDVFMLLHLFQLLDICC